MSTLDICDTRLGTGRPKAIVPIMGGDACALMAEAEAAVSAGAEIVEWRVDYFSDLASLTSVRDAATRLVTALPVPLIATLRTASQGGRVGLSEDAYADVVRTLVDANPALVDIEMASGDACVRDLVAYAHERGVRTIVSHHDFAQTPATDEMVRLLREMAGLGADVAKLAVMATCAQDSLRLMEATCQADSALSIPVITLAMGEAGTITRLVGESFGSVATFCAVTAASAPGQVALAQALPLMESLHDVLTDGRTPKES